MDSSGIDVRFADTRTEWRAGEELSAEVHLLAPPGDKVGPFELSVVWQTDGKGNTDRGVVWFESLEDQGEAERTIPLRARLPLLPLTCFGELVKIQWMVRVRCMGFLGNDAVRDFAFVVQ